MLSLLLQNLRLLGESGTTVDVEKRSTCFGWWTVDILDRGEEFRPLVAVSVPLDLLGPAVAKGGDYGRRLFCCRPWDFVKAVLLGEQVADGGVVVVKLVLILATCATEDSQDGQEDYVAESSPSVLHVGVLLDGSGSDGDWNVG
nr:unnamed protein product [Spirometra erinaceieuropaei]